MNKNLAIIGASYLQLPLIEKAREMGYTTHVFAWKCGDVGEYAADYFYPISITEKEAILEQCKKIGICGICSIASDMAVIAVNYISENLDLCGNSIHSSMLSTNKYSMRKAFLENNDPSVKYSVVNEDNEVDNISITYPVIVKPTDRSGSRGVTKVENIHELKKAVKDACSISFEHQAIIEEYVKGSEYSVECISYLGKHRLLALTQKETSGSPHFIEKGHIEPVLIDNDLLNRIQNVVFHALDTLEIKNGASHSEIIISNDNKKITIVEIGARMGGDFIGSDLVRYSTGFDYTKMVIQIACGNVPTFEKRSDSFSVKSCYIISNDDLKEFQRLSEEEPDKIIEVKYLELKNINHVTDSSNRAGCYIRRL